MTQSFQQILFLCPANSDRSRAAEARFIHRASLAGLHGKAILKGFKPLGEAHGNDIYLPELAPPLLEEQRLRLAGFVDETPRRDVISEF